MTLLLFYYFLFVTLALTFAVILFRMLNIFLGFIAKLIDELTKG